MENERYNGKCKILKAIPVSGTEFVLAQNEQTGGYMTWECLDGNNYITGHYFSNSAAAKRAAERDLYERVLTCYNLSTPIIKDMEEPKDNSISKVLYGRSHEITLTDKDREQIAESVWSERLTQMLENVLTSDIYGRTDIDHNQLLTFVQEKIAEFPYERYLDTHRIDRDLDSLADRYIDTVEKGTDAHDKIIEQMWEQLENVPMNPDTERLDAPFAHFPIGTEKEEIWEWFDKEHSKGVAYLLYDYESSVPKVTGHTDSTLDDR